MKLGQKTLKRLLMLYYKDGEFSCKGVIVGAWQTSMSHHFKRSCCNWAQPALIFLKLKTIDESPTLNTSTGHFQVRVIAPPIGRR